MSAPRLIEGEPAAAGRRIVIAAARFNDLIVASLIAGAQRAWAERGGAAAELTVVRVPGAFELPLIAKRLAASGRYDAVVALGCVIRGDTPHFDYVAGEAARGLNAVAVAHALPVGFGVLTVDTMQQAVDRAGGSAGNKGHEAAAAALQAADVIAQLRAAHAQD